MNVCRTRDIFFTFAHAIILSCVHFCLFFLPLQLITPYGNITTDPRIIHMVGEKMIFTCTTGKDKSKLKDKFPRKYGTVINLNELEKDERLANSMVSPSTTTIGPVGEYLFLRLSFLLERVITLFTCSTYLTVVPVIFSPFMHHLNVSFVVS